MKKAFLTLALFTLIGVSANLSAQTTATKPSTLSFNETTHNFGAIKEINGQVSCNFEFTNKGKTPVTVNSVKASCGCTTPDWTKEPVAPGKKGYVKATYDPKSRPGKFSKSITVSTSTGESIVLKIEGNVEPKPVEIPVEQ
jgi:hypothetical protein